MKQPLISKHIRMKILRTPLLQTLVNHSKKSTTPKKEHVDNIYKIWERFPSNERNSYKNILNLTMSTSGIGQSIESPNKALSPIKRIRSSKSALQKGRTKTLMRKSRKESPQLRVSEEAKKLVINLNKNKVKDQEESFLKPKYVAQPLPASVKSTHKTHCKCIINEITYQKHACVLLSNNKIFISCKIAASDYPQLLNNKIYSILSIGEEPNHFPNIRGGYKHLPDENYQKLVGPVFNFLVPMNANGNILICDESGKGTACVMIFAFLLKYSKVGFSEMTEVMKEVNQFCMNEKQEQFLRVFDPHRALN